MGIIIKNKDQIEGIKKACNLAFNALKHGEQFVKQGISTEFINNEIENYIRKHGGVPAPLGYHGYPKSVCTSINEVICHGIPKEEDILKEGDIIKIDVSTVLNGYFGDTCKTYAVGTICEEAQKLLNVAEQCLYLGILRVKPDAEFGIIGKEISSYARAHGYSVVYQFAGHGTGLRLHEDPTVSHDDQKYDSRKMKPGMIFTIEPMINLGEAKAIIDESDRWTARTIDGKLSAQFEHTVLVTDFGVEVLTR
jgi:methionyl aminopeptidase